MTWPCWRLVFLLMATCFLAHFNRVSIAVAYTREIQEQYEISTTAIGWVYSAFLWAYTLFMVPGGWLIDRKGPRLSLIVVGIGSAIFAFLTGCVGLVATSGMMALTGFLVVRSLMGIFSAPLHPSAARAVSLGIPVLRRTVANGLVTGAALLGIAATYILFPLLMEQLSWPGAFTVAAIVTLVVTVLWRLYAGPEMTHVSAHHIIEPTKAVSSADDATLSAQPPFFIRNKNLLLLTVSYGAYGYFQYLFFYWLGYYFEDVLKWSTIESQYYTCVPILAMAVGMPLGGWISDRLLPRFGWRIARAHLAIVGMTCSAALLYFGCRATETFSIVTMLSLSLGILGMLEGSFWVTAIEVGGLRGGLSAGILNTGGNIGGAIQNVLTPWVSDSLGYGWQAGITLGSAVCLLGGILWIWIDDPQISLAKSASSTLLPNPPATLAGPATANITLKESHLIPNSA
jgi:MFS family permease